MINKIKEDLTYARKAGIKDKVGFLSMIYSDAMMIAKNKKKELPTDEEVLSVIKKVMKGCKETVKHLENHPIEEKELNSLNKFKSEIDILEGYLPKQFNGAELLELLHKQDITNMGKTMKFFKDTYPNQYDGKFLAGLIKSLQ